MKIHIVQKGDTLWKIAKKYGVDFEELKAMNTQLSNPDMIMPGMKIKIPTPLVPVKKENVHLNKKEEIVNISKKEAPLVEHPFVEVKPPTFPVINEQPNIPIEKPNIPFVPKMPNIQQPYFPEVDVNNYYTVNMQMAPPPPPPIPQKPDNILPGITKHEEIKDEAMKKDGMGKAEMHGKEHYGLESSSDLHHDMGMHYMPMGVTPPMMATPYPTPYMPIQPMTNPYGYGYPPMIAPMQPMMHHHMMHESFESSSSDGHYLPNVNIAPNENANINANIAPNVNAPLENKMPNVMPIMQQPMQQPMMTCPPCCVPITPVLPGSGFGCYPYYPPYPPMYPTYMNPFEAAPHMYGSPNVTMTPDGMYGMNPQYGGMPHYMNPMDFERDDLD